MAVLTPVVVNFSLTSRLQNNKARTVPMAYGGAVPRLRRRNTATTSAAAADTMTVTLSAETYYIRGGLLSTTGTATLVQLEHGAAETTGVGAVNLIAAGGTDTGLVPCSPGDTVVISFTTAVAASTAYIYEYGLVPIEVNTLSNI